MEVRPDRRFSEVPGICRNPPHCGILHNPYALPLVRFALGVQLANKKIPSIDWSFSRVGAMAVCFLFAIAGCATTVPGGGATPSGFTQRYSHIELDENTDPRFTNADEIDPVGKVIPAGNNVIRNGTPITTDTLLNNNDHVQTGVASGARIDFVARSRTNCRISIREFRQGNIYGETQDCSHLLDVQHGNGRAPSGVTTYHAHTADDKTVFVVLSGEITVHHPETSDQRTIVGPGQEIILTSQGIRGPRLVPADEIERLLQWRQKFAPYYAQRTGEDGPEYYDTKVGTNVVFVLDVSGSMEGNAEHSSTGQLLQEATSRVTEDISSPVLRQIADSLLKATAAQFEKLAVAKRELVPVIQKLPETTRFTILTFANNVNAWQPELVTATPVAKESAVSFVNGLSSEGGTAVALAMEHALRIHGTQTIFFISDGKPTDAEPAQIVPHVRELNINLNARINTIGLGGDHDKDFMSTLASQNGGTYKSRFGGL